MAIANLVKNKEGLVPGGASQPTAVVDGEVALHTDTERPMRLGLWILALALGGFLLWAVLAPLDEGVPTPGLVSIDTKRKAVQHLQGGIIREVLVREGQEVHASDVLIRLDDAAVRANYEAVRQHYLTLRAMEGRLLAEQAQAPRIAFHADLVNAAADPLVRQYIATQEQLFASRRSALQAELSGIEESIRGTEAQLEGYKGMLENRRNQLALINDELKGTRELVAEGYAPKTRQLELERMAAEVSGGIADSQGNMIRAQRYMGELRQRAAQRQQEYRKEVDSQLAEVQREVQADAEKFKAAGEELNRTLIRSPAAGQVVGLIMQTVGGVIQPGQKLMDIVPQNETLLLETKVPPHLIDRVRPGLDADVRFSSFAHSPQLVVGGKVESVSGDLITEPQNPNIAYYLARVSITPEGMKQLGNRQMQPGMPVEVVFRTGERTVLTYLLHPLTKRLAAAMKEE